MSGRENKFLKNEKAILILILALSFLIKIILLFNADPALRSDSLDYQALAFSLLEGEYSLNGKPTAYVGIGYPAFLSAVFFTAGEGQFYVRLVQSVIDVFTALIFFGISRNFLNVKYSLISLAIFSFFPSNILYSQTILSEPLFGFFSMAVLYLLLKDNIAKKPTLIFSAGVLFGIATLIRTAFLPAFLLVPVYLFLYRKELFTTDNFSAAVKYSLIFITGIVLIVAPWSIRNKVMVGTFSPGTTSGINFWMGSNPNATGTYSFSYDKDLPFDYSNEAERDKEYFKLGFEYAVSHPLNYIKLAVKKTGYLFSSERMIVNYFNETLPGQSSTDVYRSADPFFLMLINIPYFIIMLLGTWGLMLFRKKSFFIYGFILTWVVTISVFVGLARYHYVLIPFFILGTVMFLSAGKGSIKEINTGKKITAAVFTLFLLAVWTAEFYLLINK
ncbi:MAG: glycosyltransferase family 39 protein [Ignavibacteria bacterium]|nr:glycosyltransferase family 39 protein [Ignavibacteria bacterium]